MRHLLVTIVAAGFICSAVSAQSLRLFLAPQGLADPADPTSAISGSPALGNPSVSTADGAQRLYLWAQLSDPDHRWVGVSLDLMVDGAAQFEDWLILNPTFEGFTRWNALNQGVATRQQLSSVNMVAVPIGLPTDGQGVAGASGAAGDLHHDAATNSTLLGWFEFSGSGDVFLAVGAKGIARLDGAQPPGDSIFLGFGDEADGIQGADFLTFSSLPDATLSVFDPADLDGDGDVDGIDLALLLGQWTGATTYAPCPPIAAADLNGDCKINGLDLAILLGAWG